MSLTSPHILTSIIFQITILISFITVFFFVYGAYIEKQIVISQVNNITGDLSGDLSLILNPNEQMYMRNILQNISPPENIGDQDAEVLKNNNVLIRQSSVIISCLFFTGIVVTIYMIFKLKLNWWYVFKNSIFGIIACIATEFIFMTFFAANYKSLDPNKVKLTVIQCLSKYANS